MRDCYSPSSMSPLSLDLHTGFLVNENSWIPMCERDWTKSSLKLGLAQQIWEGFPYYSLNYRAPDLLGVENEWEQTRY